MKEKIEFQSKKIVSVEEDSKEIFEIAKKRDIKVPSSHLGFFKSIYARIEDANLNGIRLAEKAVKEALPGLTGSQVNFEHLGAGFLCGTILDAWINAEDNNIEVVYSFYKSIYPDEYERSIELAKSGDLAVSFELLSERDSQEHLPDGTLRLHDIDFQGMGHLMDNPPAEPTAKIFEFATKCKERLSRVDDRELVCASVIEEACNDILLQESSILEDKDPNQIFITTSVNDNHFHMAKVDTNGNGTTIDTMGDDADPHVHRITDWKIQKADDHSHEIINNMLATVKEYVKTYADKWSSDIYNNFPDSSFAVIEPAFIDGITDNKKARHLPFKDRNDNFNLTNYRIALDKVDEILPVTDSISTEELRKQATEELEKHIEILSNQIKTNSNQGGNVNMELTEEQKAKIEELRAELGELVAEVSDEDLLDDTKVAEFQKAKEIAEKAKEVAFKIDSVEIRTFSLEETDGVETVVENVERMTRTDFNAMKESQAKVAELESTLEAKNSEIESVRENAEKVGQRKIQLKENEFAKDFSDEDFLDENKVEKAIQDQKNSEIIAERKEELKENEYAKDFSDEDYLNDDKIELAKTKKENDELKANKETHDASTQEDKTDMPTGDTPNTDSKYESVMASVREAKKKNYTTQKVYTRNQ